MNHLLGIGILALACVAWVLLARLAGGDCSRCHGGCGACARPDEETAVERKDGSRDLS